MKPRVTHVPFPDEEGGEIVAAAIREAGLDPHKVGNEPHVRLAYQRWVDEEITRNQFIDAVRSLKF